MDSQKRTKTVLCGKAIANAVEREEVGRREHSAPTFVGRSEISNLARASGAVIAIL